MDLKYSFIFFSKQSCSRWTDWEYQGQRVLGFQAVFFKKSPPSHAHRNIHSLLFKINRLRLMKRPNSNKPRSIAKPAMFRKQINFLFIAILCSPYLPCCLTNVNKQQTVTNVRAAKRFKMTLEVSYYTLAKTANH